MSRAKDLSITLATKFLEQGLFELASSPMDSKAASSMMPATSSQPYVDFSEETGFASLSVQSVGFADDNENGSVYIYVTKGSKQWLNSFPESLKDVKLKVNRMGKLTVRPQTAGGTTNRGLVFEHNGKIACGSSCAPTGENYSGTFGAIVKDNADKMYVLSNNHVLAACNHIPVGMPILSPSSADGRPDVRAPGEIGRHSKIVELRSGVPALVPSVTEDAAIATVTDPTKITSWQGGANGYDTPSNVIEPASLMRVKKIGRTTGLSTGIIESLIPSPTPIPYKSNYFSATVWVKDAWTVRVTGEYFALGGDSGSLVVTEDGSAAVGLLFAASPNGEYGWIIPIKRVLEELGDLSLVSNHEI